MNSILTFIYVLVTLCILVYASAVYIGAIRFNEADLFNIINSDYIGLILAGLILLGLIILFYIFKRDKKNYYITKFTQEGEINITYETIKSIAFRATSQVKGLKEVKVFVRPSGDKLNLLIKVLILPELNIPQTTMEIQRLVKSQIESVAEIPVGDVKVVVENLAVTTKLR
ncbi:MAG: alkaline shock response membrane anchor protein AmaP [Clostridiales bacterium]|nr:alkaline shock response membrane anchor protein AmaP [Clostridiales bacterium]